MNLTPWISDNPDKRWAEFFFLLYTPVWAALMALMMFTGWVETFSDTQLLIHGLLVFLPCLILPALLHRRFSPNLPITRSYWFKANVYMAVFGIFGNYFGSEYFFDVLGMVYHFPNATTTLDSALLGKGEQSVPLIMYFYTHAYFMTYHTSANLFLRRLMNSRLPIKTWLFLPATVVIGYCWAWIETKAMANPLMENLFYYQAQDVMLKYGSLMYATYFLASFPIFYFLDENREHRQTIGWALMAGASASLLTLFLLDIGTHWIGQIY